MSSQTNMESVEATNQEDNIAERKQLSFNINPLFNENEPVVTEMDSQHSNQDIAITVEHEIEPNVTAHLYPNKSVISKEMMDVVESTTPRTNAENMEPMGDDTVLAPQESSLLQNIIFPECSNRNSKDDNGMEPPKDLDLATTEGNISEDQCSISSSNHASVGSSLGQLCVYLSDSDDSTDEIHSIDMVSDDAMPSNITNSSNYRIINNSKLNDLDSSDNDMDSSSNSTSSSSTSVISDDEDDDEDEQCNNASNVITTSNTNNNKKSNLDAVRTKGEFLLEDLPPIEDLHISVPQQQCQELGKVFSIVDQLVVVQAFKNSEGLDMDSVLFLDQGKRPLGHIFEVFGQVQEPFYSVRFNSPEHIREKGIEKGMTVYWAPQSQYTSYIFLSDLLRMKGSDASWKADNEPPDGCQEFSDDEQERKSKKKPQRKNEAKDDMPDLVCPDHPKRKQSAYEQRMNERNLLMSANNAPRPFRRALASNVTTSVNMGFTPREASSGYSWRQPTISPSQLIRPSSFPVIPQPMMLHRPWFQYQPTPFNLPSPPPFDISRRLQPRIPQFDPRRLPPPPPNHQWVTPPRQHHPPPP